MAIGKRITQLDVESQANISSETLIYIVNGGVSKQVPLNSLIFDGLITADKLAVDAIIAEKIKTDAIEGRHLKANAITADKIQAGLITAEMLRITGTGAIDAATIGAAEATAFGNALTDISNLQSTVSNLEATSDGGINTFYETDQPSNPAIGDLWFDTDDNLLYRWNGAAWDNIRDPDIVQAIADAAAAADVADKKITTYYSDDEPSTDLIDGSALDADDAGDLWFDTNDGNKLYRWSGSAWVEVADNRVSTLATQMAGALSDISSVQGTIATLQATEDGGINTFYQNDAPTGGVGDLWVDTDDGNKLYRWDGSVWQPIQDTAIATAIADAAAAASTADSKITTYYGPDAPTVDLIDGSALNADDDGDLWFETDQNNKLHRFDGSTLTWVAVTDGRVDTLSTDLGSAVTNITTLQDRADGFVHTFFQNDEPTDSDVAEGTLQSGDLWIDTNDGNKLYRYNGSSFDPVQDTAIQTAIADAASAAATADNKITTYYGADAPTVDPVDGAALGTEDEGDLWFETDNNNKLHRWSGSEWIAVADSRVDSILTDLGNAVTDITTLQGEADGYVHTFYQPNTPSNSDLSAGSIGIGDLWIDTDNGNRLFRYNGTIWNEIVDAEIATAIADAAAAANIADNKITTYYGDNPPTVDSIDGLALGTEDEGDLWFETDNNNLLHRWSGSEWQVVQDTSIQDNIYTTGTTTIDGGRMTTGSLSADSIAANNITSDKIKTDSIVARHILSDEIDTNHLKANSITTVTLAASAVTAQKISSGTIASESMLASNVITGVSISSNAVVTGSVTSKNFDGSYNADTGLIDAGTEGFFLEGNTGTIVANTLVARDDIITGNMIQFSSGKALSAGPTGDLQVVVDDQTLSVQDGKLAIKAVPQTAVVIPTASVTYSGATNDFVKGPFNRGTRHAFQLGTFLNVVSEQDATASTGNINLFTIDLLDHFESATSVTSIELYNFIIELDFTNISILADTGGLMSTMYIQSFASDSASALTNTGTGNQMNFFQLKGPVFPNAQVEYKLSQINLKPGSMVATNRYVHVSLYASIAFESELTENDTLGVKIKGTPDTRLLMEGSGTVTNTLRNTNDLFSSVTNTEWQDSTGPGYDETVYD
jgi:hypothetical protein